MSLYVVILVSGSLISAFLVLHHLARIKEDGDAMLSAYRGLLAKARRRRPVPQEVTLGESSQS
jgi:hypothetical protein